MTSRVSIVWAIILKDLREFSRDKFFMYMTVIGLAAYVVFFWVLPNTVNETIRVAVRQTGMDTVFALGEQATEEGIEFVRFDTSEEFATALGLRDERPPERFDIGLEFPEGFLEDVITGEKTTVRVYVDGAVPPEIRGAMESFVREIAYSLTGNPLPVTQPDQDTILLGDDRAGDQVSFREKMRPLFAFIVLIVETLALGSLVATEIQSRTVTAIVVTRARISDFLMAKTILGGVFAFTQAALLMLLIRSFDNNPLILVVALALGAVLATGVGLVTGASGKDFMGLTFYSMLFLIPLMIPAFAALYPGTASGWIKVLPSYGLVQTIVGVATYGDGWREVLPYLGMLLAWCAALFAAGFFILKRKVESL